MLKTEGGGLTKDHRVVYPTVCRPYRVGSLLQSFEKNEGGYYGKVGRRTLD